jgi:hypothetical protein
VVGSIGPMSSSVRFAVLEKSAQCWTGVKIDHCQLQR